MEQDDALDEELVYMALLADQGHLGVAVFDAVSARLRTMQIPTASKQELASVLERVHTQFGAHRVLLSARNASAHGLLQLLKAIHEKLQQDVSVTIRKHTDFNYLRACQTIEQIRIGGTWWDRSSLGHEMSRRDVYKFLGAYFDFESKLLIQAAGALLAYLSSEKIGNQLDASSLVCLSAVERVTLDGIMHIDNGTFRSLQIFSRESHPSLVKETSRAKEGFSLYGLLNRTSTKAGATLLRQWMLAPLVDPDQINMRLDAVEFLSIGDNEDLLRSIRAKLRRFGDVSKLFNRIRERSASASDWSKVHESITTFLTVQGLFETSISEYPERVPRLISAICQERSMVHVSNLLGNIIDFDESLNEGSIVIRGGVSDILDAARSKYEDLDNVLTEVAYQIQEAHPSLSSITVQYIPQVGYVICCDAATTLPEFVFQFQEDDATFYYKDSCCRDLDASIGDIFGFIMDLQRDLLEELTVAIQRYEHCMFDMVNLVARLDCFAALADAARSFHYIRPKVSSMNEFYLSRARHPLQELIVDHFIANDIALDDRRKVLVVTGQNGSGKSVYLKMIGVLQLMSQIGSFIPAEKAVVGLVGAIFTRVHSLETATISQSSFTIDCNQMSWMLKETSRRSLCLIDEFGKGTSEGDGTALLAATVKYFVSTARQSRIIVTTHLLDVFRKGLLPVSTSTAPATIMEEPQIGDTDNGPWPVVCAMMASAEISKDSEGVQLFAPLHELRPGVTLSSNALGCALASGIPAHVVNRAAEIIYLRKTKQKIRRLARMTPSTQTWEDELLGHFTEEENWESAPDEAVATFRAMICMNFREDQSNS